VEDMKNQGKLIAKGKRNGRMFTLDVNMPKVNSMLFTHGKGARDIAPNAHTYQCKPKLALPCFASLL
jgi:hypothetical protein